MPVEPKRKRESIADLNLRPARPKALLDSYAGMGKRMSQQQIWQAQLKKAITPSNLSQVWQDLERRIEARIVEMQVGVRGLRVVGQGASCVVVRWWRKVCMQRVTR